MEINSLSIFILLIVRLMGPLKLPAARSTKNDILALATMATQTRLNRNRFDFSEFLGESVLLGVQQL